MITDDLRERRLEVIREHMDTEVTKEFDRTLATFDGHPHYEIMATGQVFDGDDEVMGYYRTTRTAFPDQRHDNVRYHVTDDAIITEFDLLGTNLGEFYGLPPTGKAFRVPIIAVFFFEGDRVVNERIYFDSASLVDTDRARGTAGSGRNRRPVKVHHLNCGTMHPRFPPSLVCHVLLIETDNGLVLVDTGHGTQCCDDPARRVGASRHLFGPTLDHEETAVRQVERLGFSHEEVRHIVVTHFDADHIGGMSDFPDAQIHATAAEVLGAMASPTRREKLRYRGIQWSHSPKIVEHAPDGEKWRGFAAAKELSTISPASCWCRCPATRGDTRAWQWMPAIAGCCTAETRSITPAGWTASRRFRASSP